MTAAGPRPTEERFRLMVEAAPGAVIVMDDAGQINFVNARTRDLFGYEPAELLGKSIELLVPEQFWHEQPESEANFRAAPQARRVDTRRDVFGRRKDGQDILIEIGLTPLETPEGRFTLAWIIDITARLKAEQAQAQLAAIVKSSEDAVIGKTLDGLIVSWNRGAEKIYGYTAEEAVGRPISMLIPSDRPDELPALLERLRQGESVESYETARLRKDGRQIDVSITISPIRDSAGNINGASTIARVITERKARERELRAIAAVSTALRTALTRAEMLPIILDQISALLEVDGVSLTRHDPASGELIIEAGNGTGLEFVGQHLPAGQGVVGQVIATGQPYLTNNAQHDTLFFWPQLLGQLTTVACVPLIAQAQAIGALWVGRRRPMTESDVQVLSAIADIAANAIYRADLFKAERDQRTLAESLRDTLATLSSTLNFDEVLDRILSSVEQVMAYDAANIMLVDQVEGIPHVVRARGYVQRGLDEIVLQLGLPVADMFTLARMTETQGAVVISDTTQYPDWMEIPETAWVRSYVGVPIRIKGQIVGFLNLDSAVPGFFTLTHAQHLQAFANEVAVAIENAQLYQEIRRYAEELETRVADRTRELTEANQRLQELDQLKSKFVSDVSHELRTPVSSLKLYAQLLDHGKPEKQAEYRRVLIAQADRLTQLVEDILNLSRLELGANRIRFEPVDLNALVEATALAYQPSAEAAGLQLGFTPGADLPRVLGERNQLAQVVTNLITNAINYTAQGAVQVSTRLSNHAVCLEVQDSGLGIDPQDMPHLFDRFYRGKRAVESKVRGTGLGLAIVKEIVDLHGGQIDVESQVNAGTTFRVCLPLVPAPA